MTTDSTAKRLWEWDVARAALLVALAWLPRTLSVAQCLIYFVVIPLWAVGLWRCGEWRKLRRDIFFWTTISFWLVAVVVSALGPRPGVTLAKTGRLAMILVISAMAGLYSSEELSGWRRLRLPVVLFLAGCSLVAALNLWEMRDALVQGESLVEIGTMRLPQLYLVAICLLVGATAHPHWKRWWHVWGVALALNGAALLGNFKRGIWFGLVAGIVAVLVTMRRWRLLVWLAWMGQALWMSTRMARSGGDDRWLAAGTLGALCGLLMAGMTENNFMTSYIFVVYMMLMGMTAALWARRAGR